MFLYPVVNEILIAAAVIPAITLLIYVYKQDRLEREPWGLLISLVLYGIIATFLAVLTEEAGSRILSWLYPENTIEYAVLMYFIVVALSEEGFKYLLLKRRTWNSTAFNCRFDGVVYAVFVSLGFALWENISYVLRYGFGTALIRAVTAVPGHACFGVFMGTFYGVAKRYQMIGDNKNSKRFRVISVVVPVILHGCYDFIATLDSEGYAAVFVVFVAILFAAAFMTVRHMSRNDRYLY